MTKYKVTQPITKYGHYYAQGEIYDDSSSIVGSLARLLQWQKTTATSTPASAGLAGKTKRELQALAKQAGLDLPKNTGKADLIAALQA